MNDERNNMLQALEEKMRKKDEEKEAQREEEFKRK